MNRPIARLYLRLRPRYQARIRAQVDATWERLISGDMSAIAEIPESCRAKVLDTAWDAVSASAWNAVRAHYNEAQTATNSAYTIEGTS